MRQDREVGVSDRRRAGRPTVAILDRARIVEAGLRLLDQSGVEGFTMARLASELRVQPSALYNHVTGKEDVLSGIRERVSDRIDVSEFLVKPWNEAVIGWAYSYRGAFAAHPPTIAMFAIMPVSDARITMAMYEQVVTSFIAGGWPEAKVLSVIVALESFILGSALDSIAPVDMLDPGEARTQFPQLARVTRARSDEVHGAEIPDDAFSEGLRALVTGLEHRLAQIEAEGS
jgi:AcrR family transcriptional regulator